MLKNISKALIITLIYTCVCSQFLEVENILRSNNFNADNQVELQQKVLAPADFASKYCFDSNGTVVNSTAIFDSYEGYVDGLFSLFCMIENEFLNVGMIDLQTLVSMRSSIAATYALLGLELDNLPKIKTIHEICNYLKGTSIGYYTDGGYSNRYGIDEICIFPDGSKISTWVLIYLSEMPTYLGLRERILSKPLPLNLPYLGNGKEKHSAKLIKEELLYKNLFNAKKK